MANQFSAIEERTAVALDKLNAIAIPTFKGHEALEPEPLRAFLPPAEPYPVDALGDVLGAAASAIHDSVKAPLALCCQSVLAAASLAAQAHYDITHQSEIKSTIIELNAITQTPTAHEKRWAHS